MLARARTCFLSVRTARGPHVTPHAFAGSGGRLWFTTSRDARKVRAVREDPKASVLLVDGDRSVLIGGTMSILDAIDPLSIAGSALDAVRSPRALFRLSLRTAEEAFGYLLSVGQLPLAWLPPNRVLLSLRPHSRIVLDRGALRGRFGEWAGHVESPELVDEVSMLRPVAPRLSGLTGTHQGALAWDTDDGPVTVPAELDGDRCVARIPRAVVGHLRSVEASIAFVVHGAEGIRPTDKYGTLVRGGGCIVELGEHEARVSIDAASITRWSGFGSSTTMIERKAGSGRA